MALLGRYGAVVSLSEIRQSATQLPPEELTALIAFLVKRDQAPRDDQVDRMPPRGNLIGFSNKQKAGKLRNWPS
jgi:hypothetical protein